MRSYFANYNSAGDILAVMLAALIMIMLQTTYSQRDRKFHLFHAGLGCVACAGIVRMTFMSLLDADAIRFRGGIIALRTMYFFLLSVVLFIYLLYIMELVGRETRFRKLFIIIAFVGGGMFALAMHLLALADREFRIKENGEVTQSVRLETFFYYYFFMTTLILICLMIYKTKLITKARWGIISVAALAITTVVVQIILYDSSLLTVTFIMPIIAVGFIFHNHGRDLETGSLNYRSYLDYYSDNHKKKLGFISLYLDGLTPEKASMMSQHFYHFNEAFFRNNVVFQLDDHRFLLLCEISKNKEFDRKMIGVIESFQELYKKYRLDYRIIWGTSEGQISNSREFYSFLVYQESLIRINYSKQILIDDFNSFEKINYVMNQLQDINNKKDLNDPRIKVFCQPVLNTRTNEYTSAEALMRFETEKYGMIYPDIFIPIAERIGMIHILTEIILHKTCMYIADLLKEGKDIERISINVSAMELKSKYFCQDVITIIGETGIPYNKIAIELTESNNEADFQNAKEIMFELQKYGIIFYLDDFGTGYSNVERIIGLPIDIIKFDRSLTILSGKDETSRLIVSSFSNIFEKANYQVLFEGVEDDEDENRCLDMRADYLQGYKYSKPIPIEELGKFL